MTTVSGASLSVQWSLAPQIVRGASELAIICLCANIYRKCEHSIVEYNFIFDPICMHAMEGRCICNVELCVIYKYMQ